MKFSIITLFPEVFEPILNSSILKRAQKKGLVEFELINLRPFGEGPHQIVDDRSYGGGVGLVFKADILAKAVKSLQTSDIRLQTPKVILTSASGTPYSQQKAQDLSKLDHIIIVCGHYEGVDQRFIDKYVDEEISIGDYVLTGGEIPAMILTDTITRLIPGVLEKPEATQNESFSIPLYQSSAISHQSSDSKLLEYPHYTRPEVFEGEKVPDVLISGHHGEVDKWRHQKALEKTQQVRPDLLKSRK